ncbi:MAG: BRCT domain-containing protein [Gammaproteobacteria bacterium]|nr:BRCT domain-containing protein [Gammaproteobacteria bacterium]
MQVGRMLEDGVLNVDESTKLMWLVRGLIDNHVKMEVPLNRDGVATNKLDDYQISALLGLCRGLIADGKVDQDEADTLHVWLMAHEGTIDNPVMAAFQEELKPFIEGRVEGLDSSVQLLQLLNGLVGGETEVGECLRATTLWLDDPPPEVVFEDRKFCLTGKFCYGTRARCEDEVRTRQGTCQPSPTKSTDYLVIGSYAEGAWIQSAYGRKIEKAVAMRAGGFPIRIISEEHWLASMG